MEKLARFLPLSLFCVFSLKLMILGAQLVDSLILLVLAGYSAYHEFKSVDDKIKDFEIRLKEQDILMREKAKEIEDVRALVGGIKLGQQLKSGQNRI
jgi:hypothetical protein